MKNTHFQAPTGAYYALATSALTVAGYAPMRRWVLVPLTRLDNGVLTLTDAGARRAEPLIYVGSRAEVAGCLLLDGFIRLK
jgi:hypothetical protein